MSPWLSAAAATPQAAPFLYLIAALCLATLAGLRAYLPLAALGLASTMLGPGGGPLLPLRAGFTALGSPSVIALLVLLAIVEFGMDKSARVAGASDALQILGRPLAGALILAGTSTPLSQSAPLLAAALGALIALVVHGAKAMLRQAVTTLSGGADSAIASTVEDVITVALVLAVILSPLVALALFALGGVVGYRTLPPLWRRYRQLVRARQAAQAGVAQAVGVTPVLGAVAYDPPSTSALSRPLMARSPEAVIPAARAGVLAHPARPGAASYASPLTSWVRPAPIPPLPASPRRSAQGRATSAPMAPMGARGRQMGPGWYDGSRAMHAYAEASDGAPTYPPFEGLYPTDAPTVRMPTVPGDPSPRA